MGKRKQTVPQRASEEKRQCLQWNMLDGVAPDGSLSILDDNDPSILQEAQHVQESVNKKGGNSTSNTQQPQFSTSQMQDIFDDNLKYCSYTVRVLPSLTFSEDEWHAVLGMFSVKLLPGLMEEPLTCDTLRGREEVWLYVSEVMGKSMLYVEEGQEAENDDHPSSSKLVNFWCVDIDIPTEVLAVFDKYSSKMVVVTMGQYDSATMRFNLTIHAREGLLCNPKYPSEHVKMKKQNILLKVVMSHFYRLAPPVFDQEISSMKHDIENLYSVVKATHDKEEITADVEVQHPSLIPRLRPYQQRGVSWMLVREGFNAEKSTRSKAELPLHMLYEEVTTPDGRTLYYNKYLARLTRERQEEVMVPPGGILADEMGLGKTVEVLACILLHKSPPIEQPPRLPTLKEMKIEKGGNRHIHVQYVHVKLKDPNPQQETLSEVQCQNQVELSTENKCIENTVKPKRKQSGFIGQSKAKVEGDALVTSEVTSQRKVKVEGDALMTPEAVESVKDGQAVIPKTEDSFNSDLHGNSNDRQSEVQGQETEEGQGQSNKADTCDSTPSAGHLNSLVVSGETGGASEGIVSGKAGNASKDIVNSKAGDTSEDIINGKVGNASKDIVSREVGDASKDIVSCEVGDASEDIVSCEVGDASEDIVSCEVGDASEDIVSCEVGDASEDIVSCEVGDASEDIVSREVGDASEGIVRGRKGDVSEDIVGDRKEDAYEDSVIDNGNNMDTSNALVTVNYDTQITPETKESIPNGVDVDMTRPVPNGKLDNISGECADKELKTNSDIIQVTDEISSEYVENGKTTNLDVSQERDEISDGFVDNDETTARDCPVMAAGSQSARRLVKKRKRKNWTKKKKPRCLSTQSSINVGDSDVEDVTEKSETGAVCNTEKPQEEQIQKQEKRKRKSVKKKATTPNGSSKENNNGGKDSMVKKDESKPKKKGIPSLVKKDESKPKKKGIPSRFVELVEESSFKPKYQFSASAPVRQKNFFECICGAKWAGASVQCVDCGLHQHAECVHYDLDDPLRDNFRCPHCHVSAPPIKSGTTLIISPSSICHQWVDEILKHINSQSLKVFVYTGVNKLGFIQPRTLAQQDIVITTYETLRKEIDYVDLPHSNSDTARKFRHPKRFMAIPSPMTAVEWWRVCLDEAQMVEVTTSKTAEMALRLSAVNRWCVTGTPIQKSVSDVYGLLLFLGLDPYWVKHWWTTLLYDPFCHGDPEPLHNVLSSVLWRNAKKDVIDQINIPSQSEHVHWLTFSPVEDHFYRRQYNDCATAARQSYSKWSDLNTKLSSLDRQTVSQLLSPLLRLRQACCHPQAVRGEFIPLQKSTMTMEELLESLTKKAQLECEESHRQLVASINGTAGIHIIENEYKEAVDVYREVLWSVEEHKDYLRTDKLQLLHTLYNLNEILSLKPEGVDPTIRDSLLKQQADELKENYMLKAEAKVTSSKSSLVPTQQNLNQFRTELSDGMGWWLDVIKFAEERSTDEILVEMVKSELMRDYVDNHTNPHVSMSRLFRGSRGLELTVNSRLTELESSHEKLLQGIEKLCEPQTREMMNVSVECCLRPKGQILKSCQLCLVDKLFEDYESKLFSITQKPTATVEGDHTNTTRRQGTWADSELEKSLKVILSFAKLNKVDPYLIEYGTTHIKLMDTLKKEFKNLRSVWISKHEQFQALDELDMATTRLRLRLPDEEVPKTTQLHVLQPAELASQKLKLRTEKTVAKNELRKKVGQLFYLKNLSKNQIGNEDGVNPEPCPICQRELGVEWSVIQCGHCYCIECIRVMVVQYSFGSHNRRLKCPVCRELNFISDISYVSTKVTPVTEGMESIRVKGSYSIKIEAVVRCMLGIQKNDPTAKVLVFSSWKSVLGIIAEALNENNITHRTLYTGKFQNQLTSFREEKDVTALLLPIQSGSNGLNLIEATYVLLVEPILNPAQELQAIGRVHRIGQTRKTEVHRFLIRGTIEEKMYSMLKTIEDAPSSHNTEENVLTIGHLTSLFCDEEGNREVGDTANTENDQEMEINDGDGTEEATSRSQSDTGNNQGTSGQSSGISRETTPQNDDMPGETTVLRNNTSEVCVIEDSASEPECILSSDEESPCSDFLVYDDPYILSSDDYKSHSEDSEEELISKAIGEQVNISSPGTLSNSEVIDVESEVVEESMVVDEGWESHVIDLTSTEESSSMLKDTQTTSIEHEQKILQEDLQAVVDLISDDENVESSEPSQGYYSHGDS